MSVKYSLIFACLFTIRPVFSLQAPAQKSITTEEAYVHFAVLYIKYIQVLRKLTDCYDQIVHPQKRIDIRNALDTVCPLNC